MDSATSKKHDGLPVLGYRAQAEENVDLVNTNKQLEEVLLSRLDLFAQMEEIDKRWLAIGRTQIEQGFMAINRAIFRPARVQVDLEG